MSEFGVVDTEFEELLQGYLDSYGQDYYPWFDTVACVGSIARSDEDMISWHDMWFDKIAADEFYNTCSNDGCSKFEFFARLFDETTPEFQRLLQAAVHMPFRDASGTRMCYHRVLRAFRSEFADSVNTPRAVMFAECVDKIKRGVTMPGHEFG